MFPKSRAGKPKQQSSSLPLHEGIFPTYILFPRFHLGIENCHLFIEKKEVNMQSSNFKFPLISLLEGPTQSQLNILAFNVCWEEAIYMTENAYPGFFLKQPFPFPFDCLPSYLNRNIFELLS